MGPPREGVGGKWGIQAELIACVPLSFACAPFRCPPFVVPLSLSPFRCPPFADRLRVIAFLLSPVMRSLQEAWRGVWRGWFSGGTGCEFSGLEKCVQLEIFGCGGWKCV